LRAGLRQRVDHAAHPDPARRDRGAHRHAERPLQAFDVVADAARLRLVVHVEHEHGAHAELPELQREQQRAPQVLRVGDLHHHGIRLRAHGAHQLR
jgi:hypothetical protein